MDVYEREYFHAEGSFDFKTDLELKKGSYELYFTGMYDKSYNKYQVNDFTDLIQEVIRAITDEEDQPYYRNEKYYMTLSGEEGFTANNGREYLDKMAEKSIVSIVRTGNNEIETKGFSLIKETKL